MDGRRSPNVDHLLMEILIIAIATALNLIVLKWKAERERYGDLFLDISALIALNWMFGGTLGGMMIAMMASAMISTYLFFSPPTFFDDEDEVEET